MNYTIGSALLLLVAGAFWLSNPQPATSTASAPEPGPNYINDAEAWYTNRRLEVSDGERRFIIPRCAQVEVLGFGVIRYKGREFHAAEADITRSDRVQQREELDTQIDAISGQLASVRASVQIRNRADDVAYQEKRITTRGGKAAQLEAEVRRLESYLKSLQRERDSM